MSNMNYRRFYYREVPDEAPEGTFECSVNFVLEEGSISYYNKDRGRTTRGAKLREEDLKHCKLILDKGKPEEYRDGLEEADSFFKTDGSFWEMVIEYSDEKPELRISNEDEYSLESNKAYKIPEFIRELKEFASIKLGLEDLGRQA